MFIGIRRVTMVQMATKKEKSDHWENNDVFPNIATRIQTLISKSRTCKAFKSGDGFYDVRDSIVLVILNERTCLCHAREITGTPCKHDGGPFFI